MARQGADSEILLIVDVQNDFLAGGALAVPDHCIQGTPGARFPDALAVPQAELIVRKGHHRDVDSYSAFREADRPH